MPEMPGIPSNPAAKVRRRPRRLAAKPDEVIETLKACHGLIEPSAIRLGMSRSNLYNYISNHSRVSAALKSINAGFTDHLEGKLYQKAVQDGDFNSLKLALSAKGRDRGYGPDGALSAAAAAGGSGGVTAVTIMSIPPSYFFGKRDDRLLTEGQVAAEQAGASDEEIAMLAPAELPEGYEPQ